MECPNASSATYPADATGWNARTTYSLNICLIEQPEMAMRNNRNLMMLREVGRHTASMLRPSNPSNALPNGNPANPPLYPFLTEADLVPPSEYLPHGNGSFIVFADGHVKHFTIDYYPPTYKITPAQCWDPGTQQWYNYYWANPVTEDQKRKNKTIAISL